MFETWKLVEAKNLLLFFPYFALDFVFVRQGVTLKVLNMFFIEIE